MYIQDKVEEYADEVFDLMNNGAHLYFCGLKGMMPGACVRARVSLACWAWMLCGADASRAAWQRREWLLLAITQPF